MAFLLYHLMTRMENGVNTIQHHCASGAFVAGVVTSANVILGIGSVGVMATAVCSVLFFAGNGRCLFSRSLLLQLLLPLFLLKLF